MKRNLELAKAIPAILFVFINLNLIASNDNFPIGARSAAMGHSSVTMDDFWSLFNNQAGLTSLKQITAGINFENKFMISELGVSSAGIVLPFRMGVFGLNFSYSGYSAFSQSKVGFAYARSFSKKLSVGIQLDYLGTQISENYASSGLLTFEIGIRVKLSEKLVLAIHSFNPLGIKNKYAIGDKANVIFRLGLMYLPAENIVFTIETVKNLNFKPSLRAGVEFKIPGNTFVRVGYKSKALHSDFKSLNVSSEFTFGFGLNIKKVKLDLAASVNQVLGWTPSISLIFQLGRLKNEKKRSRND